MDATEKVRGWVRPSRRHPEAPQVKALRAAGCGAVYVAGRDVAISDFVRGLRKPKNGGAGDVVLVTTLARLASSRDELNDALRAIRARGAVIVETTTGRTSSSPDDLQAMIFDAVHEIATDRRALTRKQAKAFGALGGKAKGKAAQEDRTPVTKARAAWHGNNHMSNDEVLRLPEMRGWTEASAYRHLGKRNRMLGVRVGRPRKIKR